jgi:hypothetical protein
LVMVKKRKFSPSVSPPFWAPVGFTPLLGPRRFHPPFPHRFHPPFPHRFHPPRRAPPYVGTSTLRSVLPERPVPLRVRPVFTNDVQSPVSEEERRRRRRRRRRKKKKKKEEEEEEERRRKKKKKKKKKKKNGTTTNETSLE